MNSTFRHFDQVIVLFNPASTHAQQAKKRIEELRQIVPAKQFLLLHTSSEGREANKDLLLSNAHLLGPKTLLCIAAGDGTVNMAVEALASCATASPKHAAKDASKTIILPLWGGNANDVAHMLNGPAYRISVPALLEKGQVVSFYPLHCTLTDSKGTVRKHLAVGYIGFGASALTARRLNEPPHRDSVLHNVPGGRIIQETMTVFRALLGAPAFKIEDDGVERQIYERMFINGSRIGKMQMTQLRLTDEHFYKTTLDDKRLSVAFARVRELLRKPSVERAGESTSFRCIGEAWVQFDGEAIRIAPGTLVEVTRSTVPLRALSVRLSATP